MTNKVSSPRRTEGDARTLLSRVAGGDQLAVSECIDRYGPLVWSLVRKSTRDHAQAEDAVQEVFIAVWRAAEKYDPKRGSESLFITTIARRRMIDRYRKKLRRPETQPIDEVAASAELGDDLVAAGVEMADEAQQASLALERLEPEQKKLLELWIVSGLTHNEIATSTGMPLGTVKSKIRRGLLRVREMLAGRQLASSPEGTA